jgi:hypothetical protein
MEANGEKCRIDPAMCKRVVQGPENNAKERKEKKNKW